MYFNRGLLQLGLGKVEALKLGRLQAHKDVAGTFFRRRRASSLYLKT